MGNIHKLLTRIKRTKREFDKRMNQHIKDLDKIRQIVKYNYTPNGKCPNKSECKGQLGAHSCSTQQVQTGSDNFYLDLRGEA